MKRTTGMVRAGIEQAEICISTRDLGRHVDAGTDLEVHPRMRFFHGKPRQHLLRKLCAMVGGQAIRRFASDIDGPPIRSLQPFERLEDRSASLCKARASAVAIIRPPSRLNRTSPVRSSSCAMARETAGWEMLSLAAAAVVFPSVMSARRISARARRAAESSVGKSIDFDGGIAGMHICYVISVTITSVNSTVILRSLLHGSAVKWRSGRWLFSARLVRLGTIPATLKSGLEKQETTMTITRRSLALVAGAAGGHRDDAAQRCRCPGTEDRPCGRAELRRPAFSQSHAQQPDRPPRVRDADLAG